MDVLLLTTTSDGTPEIFDGYTARAITDDA